MRCSLGGSIVGILPRSANGHPGFGSNASVRSNDDLATARKENTRPLAGAAEHPAVHRDALSAVTVIAHFGSALHGIRARVDAAHLNTACMHAAGEDRSTVDKDVDGYGRTHTRLIAHDAVCIIACRYDGAVLHLDVDVACATMPANDAVGALARRRDGDALNVDVDVACGALMNAIDAVGFLANRRDGDALSVDVDVACGALMNAIDAVGILAIRRDGAVLHVDVDVACA